MLNRYDDYPLQAVPPEARTVSQSRLGLAAFGSMTFLAQESLGAMITMQFGFIHLLLALGIAAAVIMILSVPVVKVAITGHIDIDLITRGCGFGYLGASLSSFIYAGYICVFLAFESLIVLDMLRDLFGIPMGLGYFLFNSAAMILGILGIRAIVRFQNFTNVIWLAIQLAALGLIIYMLCSGTHPSRYAVPRIHQDDFNAVCLGYATGIVLAFITQTGEQVDYLRFSSSKGKGRTFFSLLGGVFWFVPIMANMVIGSVLSYWLLGDMATSRAAAEPHLMFSFIFAKCDMPQTAALLLVTVFVILSQLKINVTNLYSGSLAWSNFSARVTHVFPGRAFWVVFNVLIAFVIVESDIVNIPLYIFGVISILGLSWYGVLFTDITINRMLGLRPKEILFKRNQISDVNPVGVTAMAAAVAIGLCFRFGCRDAVLASYAHFISLGTAVLGTVLMAALTNGRHYRAYSVRDDHDDSSDEGRIELCSSCGKGFRRGDLTYCPSCRGYICAECCSLDAGCYEQCKQEKPSRIRDNSGLRLAVNYLCVMTAFSLMLWLIAAIAFRNEELSDAARHTFKTVFLLTDLAVAIFYLMFVFVLQGRRKALKDLNSRNLDLEQEIARHRQTQLQLVEARNRAESANLAQNRYLSGLSHELRTPLNTILGYIQLLRRDRSLNAEQTQMLGIIGTSGGYLADLIEGLLDISRIEAGKLEIRSEKVRLREMVTQLCAYFGAAAKSKGIGFTVDGAASLPDTVRSDGKRMRQIMTNLLSNAVKYTVKGGVDVSIKFRNDIMTMVIADTGVGMTPEFMKLMFEPFERAKDPSCAGVSGTGLGLTITRLLTTIMGGDLEVKSEHGKGSEFTVRMKFYVSEDDKTSPEETARRVAGYIAPGNRIYKVLEVDDNENHANLMRGMLAPIGFDIAVAGSVKEALLKIAPFAPDIVFLDISLPDGTGWDILKKLRHDGFRAPVVMVSAEAAEENVPEDLKEDYDGYIIKPVNMATLFDTLHRFLKLSFYTDDVGADKSSGVADASAPQPEQLQSCEVLDDGDRDSMRSYLKIGYLGGVGDVIDKNAAAGIINRTTAEKLKGWILSCDLAALKKWADYGNN